MNKRFLLVTEANEKVASGHLIECLECCHELLARGHEVLLFINDDMPKALKERIRVNKLEYKGNIQENPNILMWYLENNFCDVILLNLREVHNKIIEQLRMYTSKIVVIDELGHRKLEPDVLINPMVDSKYWKYETNAETYFGHQYLVLSRILSNSVDHKKQAKEMISEVTISMGGVDPYETTLRLLEWMRDYPVKINCVLGAGFRNVTKAEESANRCRNCIVYKNLSLQDMYQLMNQSDLVIAAGGNTLHELATLGSPGLIIPSVLHEIDNGKNFESVGAVKTLSITTELSKDEFEAGYRMISNRKVRNDMIESGQKFADGLGYIRVCEILEKL